MRQRTAVLLLAVLLPTAFLAGALATRPGDGPGSGRRQVLYYVDPMNPSFRSPEPGTAPCGMPLEPVFADGPAAGAAGAAPPGAVTVRADRLQLIGVAREPVRSGTARTTLRLSGTVAPDETRLFRITAATNGRIHELGQATTGSHVAKGELLGTYYAGEIYVPQQNFIRLYESYQKKRPDEMHPQEHVQGGGQLAIYARNADGARQNLLNLGMTAEQIEEVVATRQPAYLVQLRAPADGLVTSRNVSPGQSFESLSELFTIADLGRVWVLADAFEGQEAFFTPGTRAIVTQPGSGRRFAAVVSAVPPLFEAATRTLKVRLELANPGLLLRPDMLVDVELPVEIGPALFVPKEAVLDSGTRRLVFVEQGGGVFVPRTVRTGRRLGERVEILGGLMEGETVVTSGNFLLDSESRMRAAGAQAAGAALDPICGMEVEEVKARAQGLVSLHGGTTWYFCTPGCKQAFDRDPTAAAARAQGVTEPAAQAPQTASAPVLKGGGTMHEGEHGGMSPQPQNMRPQPQGMSLPHQNMMPQGMSPPRREMPQQQGTPQETMPLDPVCRMPVDPAQARAEGLVTEHDGETWYFCTSGCKREFDADPAAHVPMVR